MALPPVLTERARLPRRRRSLPRPGQQSGSPVAFPLVPRRSLVAAGLAMAAGQVATEVPRALGNVRDLIQSRAEDRFEYLNDEDNILWISSCCSTRCPSEADTLSETSERVSLECVGTVRD